MKTNQASNWIVDMILFLGFIAAFLFDITGLLLHQWLGIAVALLACLHLSMHWDWVVAVTQRFFGKTSGQARLYYLLDAFIIAGFFGITLTGLAVSSWLDLTLANASTWVEAHTLASIVTLIATAIKLALHARWIASVSKKILASPKPDARHPEPVPVSVSTRYVSSRSMSRKDFLQVMGVVGVASVIALNQAVNELTASGGDPVVTGTNSQAGSLTSSSSAADGQACTIRCGRGCSFPGHCQRYTDANGNNRCDWGECK